jgi:glutamyl-tRNA synthetase
LLAWLWARSERGGFTLRVEDLDRPRVRAGMAEEQLRELAWLGLDWDEGPDPATGVEIGSRGPYRQSLRASSYDHAIEQLGDRVYECFCSRAEIAAAASAPHGDEPRYPGTCAGLTRAQRSERRRLRAPALRFRVAPGLVSFRDRILGEQHYDVHASIGDFVLRRADGIHAYQLAVVVDDAAMGITQVLRGADLLPSTARQILLFRALALEPPRWAHAPLVVSDRGERLAKRDRSTSLSALRSGGADPAAIVAALCASAGQAEAPGRTLLQRAGSFEVARVPRRPVEVSRILG